MAGLNDADVLLSGDWQLIPSARGDAQLVVDVDCLMQDIRLEAATKAGDLFYAPDWGWSLLDFVQSEDDPLVLIEAEQRVRRKLEAREVIDPDSISVKAEILGDMMDIYASFRFVGDSGEHSLEIHADRVNVEVSGQ